MKRQKNLVATMIIEHEGELLIDWLEERSRRNTNLMFNSGLFNKEEFERQASDLLKIFTKGLKEDTVLDIATDEWAEMRDYLSELSNDKAAKGYSATETAIFVFTLKKPLFKLLSREIQAHPEQLTNDVWEITALIDQLGLYITERFIKNREEIIARQQDEMLELSTPVVKLWEGILVLPLIGTLDSTRTQIVLESLLEKIAATGSNIAIIDITGVSVIDTLVAQYLLKAVTAARLMGAECIISGISPQIAQTMVQLGVRFTDVSTKANLSDAFAEALKRSGVVVTKRQESF